MRSISIVIPAYNSVCFTLVADLQRQAEALGADYEIVVADDGSTDSGVILANRAINTLPHCRYLERKVNIGRAAIRNLLAREACMEWLLYIDADMVVCREDYVSRYARQQEGDVVVGGLAVGGAPTLLAHNLRYRYERAAEQQHTVQQRMLSPYRDFHTANFLIRRRLMLQTPFDERFRHYGYEDVLLGKQLERQGVALTHIDNPVSFEHFETNASFVSKTEEGLRTLYQFRDELKGYSTLLDFALKLSPAAAWCIRTAFRPTAPLMRRQLTGQHPSLQLFKAYKLGYFLLMSNGKTGVVNG